MVVMAATSVVMLITIPDGSGVCSNGTLTADTIGVSLPRERSDEISPATPTSIYSHSGAVTGDSASKSAPTTAGKLAENVYGGEVDTW